MKASNQKPDAAALFAKRNEMRDALQKELSAIIQIDTQIAIARERETLNEEDRAALEAALQSCREQAVFLAEQLQRKHRAFHLAVTPRKENPTNGKA